MTFLVLLALLVAVALLGPRYGVDSRRLSDRTGGPPDVLPDPPDPSRGALPPVTPDRDAAGARWRTAGETVGAGSPPPQESVGLCS